MEKNKTGLVRIAVDGKVKTLFGINNLPNGREEIERQIYESHIVQKYVSQYGTRVSVKVYA